MKNVIVIGAGTSVKQVDLLKLRSFAYVIGVNDAGLYASVDECVSMDRLWFENRWDKIPETIPLYMRENAIKNPHQRQNLILYKNNHKLWVMSDDEGVLNGTNSGMAAINRAYHLRPDRVFLLGFDMHRDHDGKAYWYPPYSWAPSHGATGEKRYIEWSMQYASIAQQFQSRRIELYNVGLTSRIQNVPKISIHKFMELIDEHNSGL